MEFGLTRIPLDGSRLITFRAAALDDEPFLIDLYRSTRLEELALTNWDDSQRDAFVRMQFNAQQTHYRQNYPEAEHLIILVDGKSAGRLYVAEIKSEIRIVDVTILTEYRNAGLGTQIVRRLMDQAAAIKKPLTIYVESFNPSLRLFGRLGFIKSGESGYSYLLKWQPTAEP
jgi:RimJ/RimL family protein N-acetyltransferase